MPGTLRAFHPAAAERLAWRGVQSSAPPWSARPSHACWLTWSSWAAACSGGPSWRPTSKRFRVRAGSLHLSSRRLLSAVLLLCADGGKVSAATKQTMVRGGMMEAEARNILNVKPKAAEAEIQEVRNARRAHGL